LVLIFSLNGRNDSHVEHAIISRVKWKASRVRRTVCVPIHHHRFRQWLTPAIGWLFLFTALSPSFAQSLSITGNIGVETTKDSPAPINRLTVAILGFENKTGNPAEAYWRIAASKLMKHALWEVKTIRISPSVRYALKHPHLRVGRRRAGAIGLPERFPFQTELERESLCDQTGSPGVCG
jgi:hypothetical protein